MQVQDTGSRIVYTAHPWRKLTLNDTALTRNSLTGSPGITVQGGGLFTTFPVTLSHSLIALNSPGQCFGCTSPASPPQSRKTAGPHRPRAASPDLGLDMPNQLLRPWGSR